MIKARNLDQNSVAKQETLWFDNTVSLGAGVALTTIQQRIFLPYAAKLVKVISRVSAKAGAADPQVDVYNTEGSPASILAAPRTLAAADTSYSNDVAVRSTKYASGYAFTSRAQTNAGDGSLGNLKVGIVVEKRDSNDE